MKIPQICLLAILALGITIGCHKDQMTVEFVVTNGFSGILKLRASPNGAEVKPRNGYITLVFPASGTLDVKGRLPTLEWHKEVARFQDGTSIPIFESTANVPDNTVALRGLGLKNNNTESWYLVGKADQMQDAMNSFYGFEVPRR